MKIISLSKPFSPFHLFLMLTLYACDLNTDIKWNTLFSSTSLFSIGRKQIYSALPGLIFFKSFWKLKNKQNSFREINMYLWWKEYVLTYDTASTYFPFYINTYCVFIWKEEMFGPKYYQFSVNIIYSLLYADNKHVKTYNFIYTNQNLIQILLIHGDTLQHKISKTLTFHKNFIQS